MCAADDRDPWTSQIIFICLISKAPAGMCAGSRDEPAGTDMYRGTTGAESSNVSEFLCQLITHLCFLGYGACLLLLLTQ